MLKEPSSVKQDDVIFYVVRYDAKWYEDGRDLMDMSVLQPEIVDECDNMDEAKQLADHYNAQTASDSSSETISIKMRNGQMYNGKRYFYSYYKGV